MIDRTDPGWRAAVFIIETLRAAGHEAILAGGCVRDMLLSLPPKDFDVATNAPPERVIELFPKARKVGAQFGVILVRKFSQNVEVATFRTEGGYSDGRRPDRVAYGTAEDDAKRRDFTVNGLFYDPVTDRVIDYVGGQDDLARRLLRTIGEPAHRFAEDHLRMLRAVRLVARLSFALDVATAKAIRETAAALPQISRERIWMELEQILAHPSRAVGWRLLRELSLRGHLSDRWPEDESVDGRAAIRLEALPSATVSPAVAFAAVTCDFPPKTVRDICRSLRMSNELTSDVNRMITALPAVRETPHMELADLKMLMAQSTWPDLLHLLRADLIAKKRDTREMQSLLDRVAAIPAHVVRPAPLVTGHDLTALGETPGAKFGEVLDEIYRRQLNEEITDRGEAISLARRLLNR